MTVPSWWEATLLALAAYRVWRLVAVDDLLEPWRGRVLDRTPTKLDDFVNCPWCLGAWLSVAWWGVWEAWPHATLVAASPWAIAAAVAIIATRVEGE